jgi:hypothetical protein
VKRRGVLAVAGVLTSLLGAPRAQAAEPSAEDVARARTLFNAGAQAYANGSYANAARSFEQAQALAPRPQLLFSLAQAERRHFLASSDAVYLRRAIEHYKLYLQEVHAGGRRSEAAEAKADLEARLARLDPQQVLVRAEEKRKPRLTVYSATPGAVVSFDGGPPVEQPYFGDLEPGKHTVRVAAEGFFDETRDVSGAKGDVPLDVPLRERPAKLTVGYDKGGELYVDGRIVATTPLAAPIDVPPGPHVLALAVNGHSAWTQEIVLPRGKPVRVDPKPTTSGQRVVAYSLIGAGTGALVVGGVFAVMAIGRENHASDLESAGRTRNLTPAEALDYNAALDRRDTFRTVSAVSLSAGAALAAGGAFLYFFDKPAIGLVPPRSTEPTPAPRGPLDVAAYPVVGPGTVGAGLSARF